MKGDAAPRHDAWDTGSRRATSFSSRLRGICVRITYHGREAAGKQMTASDFQVDAKRDATDSIRGYVYQAYQSVLAWIRLQEREILMLEGAEDFDIHLDDIVVANQVKDARGNITLRTPDVVDALNNYWGHRERNPDYEVVLRFLTTAEAGLESGKPFGPGVCGLDYWQRVDVTGCDIQPLRQFLLSLKLSDSLRTFVEAAADDELREQLIHMIKWDLGAKPKEALEYAIEDKLKVHGSKYRINTHHSCNTLPHLLKRIVDTLSSKGLKQLTYGDFLSCFDEATTESIPRSELVFRSKQRIPNGRV
jgi:hypothetical protein